MSDEEKKAIDELWHFDCAYNREIKIVLNLIEKQFKEIEELKNADLTTVYLNGFYDGEKKVKDKIKAKIEELENYYRELYKQDNSPNEFLIGQDCLSKLSILQEVKQSLLEKE